MSAAVMAVPLYERAAALVEQLFLAPSDPACWERVLAALCAEVSESAVAFVIGSLTPMSPAFLLGHGIGVRRVSQAVLRPSVENPSAEVAPVGAVLPVTPLFAETRLYQEILRPEGIAPDAGLCVVLGRNASELWGAFLLLSRDPAWRPRQADRALLEILAPYLIRGVTVGLRINERRSGIEALLSVLDALALGVALLDERGEVSFLNCAAAEQLGTSAGLTRSDAAGVLARSQRSEALRSLLRRELAPGASPAAHSPGARSPLHVVSTPLHGAGASEPPDTRFSSALFFGAPQLPDATPRDRLTALYGLTPGEERLALRLAAGESLREAAERLGIRLGTARTVLRSVFEKTDTHRQASLVRLVLALVGQVRPEPPRG